MGMVRRQGRKPRTKKTSARLQAVGIRQHATAIPNAVIAALGNRSIGLWREN